MDVWGEYADPFDPWGTDEPMQSPINPQDTLMNPQGGSLMPPELPGASSNGLLPDNPARDIFEEGPLFSDPVPVPNQPSQMPGEGILPNDISSPGSLPQPATENGLYGYDLPLPGHENFIRNPRIEETDGGNEGATDAGKSERLWNDSDYPFFPKPRGRGSRSTVSKRIKKMRKIKITPWPVPYLQTCMYCGMPSDKPICDSCLTRKLLEFGYCPVCQKKLVNGKCVNSECPNNGVSYCPETGEADAGCGQD